MQKTKIILLSLAIPSLFFVGIIPTSLSDDGGSKQIIINIEPPQDEFQETPRQDESESPENNSGGSGNGLDTFVTGSNYALNGIPILINTPEGVRLNDQLTDQQDLEKLEQIHGEKFWERVDTLTYDHYGLANAMFDPNTKNSYFSSGGKHTENINSNFEYYVLERGYDPREPTKIPNNIFSPTKYDLARAVMQKAQDANANNLNLDTISELNLEVLSPNAFQMTEEQENIMYHTDVEDRALSILQNVLPTLSSSSISDDQNSQNNDGMSNQQNLPLTSMPGNSENSSSPSTTPQKMDEEIFQNTEHIKNIIAQENFEPNYENKDKLIIPLTEILLSVVLAIVASTVIFIIRRFAKKPKKFVTPLVVAPTIDHVAETQKLLDSANRLYKSKQIKDAYERFSQAIRFYYSYDYDLKREVTTFEILNEIEKMNKSDYKIVYDCLVLCGIIEFAKHHENKNDFKKCMKNFSNLIKNVDKSISVSGVSD